MRIGIPKEAQAGETRVAATPNTVEQLREARLRGCGRVWRRRALELQDAAYEAAGATIGDPFDAEIVFGVNAPAASSSTG